MSEPTREELLAQIAELQRQLNARVEGDGAIAQENSVAAGADGIAAKDLAGQAMRGDHGMQIQAEQVTFNLVEKPVASPAINVATVLGRYLQHVIAQNRYLQLQGIRSSGNLVDVELERVYVRLRTVRRRTVEAEKRWLAAEAKLAPGERGRRHNADTAPIIVNGEVTVTVEEALTTNLRLVVLGDPGSGKTTLLRYLALLYARTQAEVGSRLVQEKLSAAEPARLPIFVQLRQVGQFLGATPDTGIDGHVLLLRFLVQSLGSARIVVPEDFFDDWLDRGDAAILLDGLDEVADPELRRRVARLVEQFTVAYPKCRYAVTSRIVGYAGAARLGEGYATTTVRDFSLEDITHFLAAWHRAIALNLYGLGSDAGIYAAEQTRQLLEAIESSPRIRELAINPLMLTVIAMVHRDRVRLPDRRAELYAEAVEVLLGAWDAARGVQEAPILPDDKPFVASEKRLLLQTLALQMHEQQTREIEIAPLRELLVRWFADLLLDKRTAGHAADRFLVTVEGRAGLLSARGEGVYSFSHLTFQEYLAARAVANRRDAVDYTLQHTTAAWWREVILLEAGYLSTEDKARTAELIRAIATQSLEPVPYHNLVLAAECLRDVGENRVPRELVQMIQGNLRRELQTPPPQDQSSRKADVRSWIERRGQATEALARAGAGYWKPPWGEPEWVPIPAGEFWMSGERDAMHRVYLPDYWMARTPTTNQQYQLFVAATSHRVPGHWENGSVPKGRESHPVVNTTWKDAVAYCQWLSTSTGRRVALPSAAEWEKAARGTQEQRTYPWGDEWRSYHCNSVELGVGTTTPVGIFLEGASPYGCLDMAGNVWEWTSDKNPKYSDVFGLKGGSWYNDAKSARASAAAAADGDIRYFGNGYYGFRVVCVPISHG